MAERINPEEIKAELLDQLSGKIKAVLNEKNLDRAIELMEEMNREKGERLQAIQDSEYARDNDEKARLNLISDLLFIIRGKDADIDLFEGDWEGKNKRRNLTNDIHKNILSDKANKVVGWVGQTPELTSPQTYIQKYQGRHDPNAQYGRRFTANDIKDDFKREMRFDEIEEFLLPEIIDKVKAMQ